MIKSMLTVLEDADKAESFLKTVCAMADRLDAHLQVVVLTPALMVFPGMAPFGGMYVPDSVLAGDETVQMDRVRTIVGAAGERVTVSGLRDDMAWLAGDLRNARPVADLIVIGTDQVWTFDWLRHRVVRTLVMSAGAPVLLLPPGRSVGPVNHAVLGCKPTLETLRAIRDLIDMAEPGARIDVVTIGRPPDKTSDRRRFGDEVVHHLERHGFVAEAKWRDDGEKVADQLQTYALEAGADLLVIGAYAHSRVREVLLGGVTHDLVEDARLPTLLSR